MENEYTAYTAYQQGYTMGVEGFGHHCPYEPESDEWEEWWVGYNEGRADYIPDDDFG